MLITSLLTNLTFWLEFKETLPFSPWKGGLEVLI